MKVKMIQVVCGKSVRTALIIGGAILLQGREAQAQFFKDPIGTIGRAVEDPGRALDKLNESTGILVPVAAPELLPVIATKKI